MATTAAKSPTKPSTTVRVSEQTHYHLRELASQSNEPMQAVIDKAVEQYRRQRFWDEMKTAYALIESDPAALAEMKAEYASFEGTLMDGLDPNEVWTDADFVVGGGHAERDGCACA